MMTVVNKVSHRYIISVTRNEPFLTSRFHTAHNRQFVVSGHNFSMTFLLLTIQSVVCCGSVFIVKKMGIITFRDFDMKDAKAWFPISALLVSVIYTGSKSLVCATQSS